MRFYLIFIALVLSACGSPRDALNKVIREKNFIPYEMPMPSTRVGTMLRGNNSEMYLVARPEKCFPDTAPQPLRWIQPTDLPSEYRQLEFGFNLAISPIFSTGNFSLGFRASANDVKTVQIEFTNPSVEFLDESAFHIYYQQVMSEECKSLLTQYPFIGQGLRIESMSFVFKDSRGAAINLTSRVGEIVDISPGVSWRIDRDYTLVITTPKYIGYRMAQLISSSSGVKLSYASSANSHGHWIFRDVDVPRPTGSSPELIEAPSVRLAEPLTLR